MELLQDKLSQFTQTNKFNTKGPLCVALHITRYAKEHSLPLNPDALRTDSDGQVLGLGKSRIQSILKDHGITRLLASEGGRTSRGSMGNMREYVAFLNELCQVDGFSLDEVENYWVAQVNAFFQAKPFKLSVDHSNSMVRVVSALLEQAMKRQQESNGTQYVGALIQHLVGAKLDCLYGINSVEHHSVSTSDSQIARHGDFYLGDTAIHVTTAPSEALLQKCKSNLDAGLKPLIVTLRKGQLVAEGLAENQGIKDRVDIFPIEQFLSANIYELGSFDAAGRKTTIQKLIDRYNELINQHETDSSLKIELTL